jgi:ubiquitin carboxyl-terminal hydrolase 4/11/15
VSTVPAAEIPTNEAAKLISDPDFPLDLSIKSQTVGEIGLVEPLIGIAIEHKENDASWPMDDTPRQDPGQPQSSPEFPTGRTLGASPNSFTTLNRRPSQDEPSLGTINGKPIAGPIPGSYPTTRPSFFRATSPSSERYKSTFNARFAPPPKEDRVRGITGLNNLGKTPPNLLTLIGNTCYMNSALQCLVHCRELTEYFLAQVYKSELNETNPLGMNGMLAKHYAYLIAALYNPEYTKLSLPPTEFKKTLGRFAPNFSGYSQQDSQEFLAFLLDGLHEDLNRVHKKPYVERDELVGVEPSDQQLGQLGQKSWDGHKLRNDSVIVDLCQGMYKSTVVCPVCEVVSVTFDPFMDLSVPLPIKQMYHLNPGC